MHSLSFTANTTMKTLVAFDGSEFSKRALETALQSKKPDDNLVIVSAVPMLPWDPFMSSSQLKEINEESFKRQLDSIKEQVDQICKEKAVSNYEIAVEPANDIREKLEQMVKDRQPDLLVVGTRGLTGMDRFFGSVSYYLMHNADCSVLIVK